MSSPVISVSHLKRGFKSGSGSITVLKDISLTVNRGEFVAVMGASGSRFPVGNEDGGIFFLFNAADFMHPFGAFF